MRIVLDTNVFVSGVFFSGPPLRILEAWRDRRVNLVLSPEIFEEYQAVSERLSERFAAIEVLPILALVATHATLVSAPPLRKPLCADPDDDKFFACAVASRCKVIVSGDAHLLEVSGYKGINVLRPRQFVDKYLA